MSTTYSGSIPAELDARLQRRDSSPLGPSELLRVQAINRGKNPRSNQRFSVMDSGDVFEAGHSDDTSDWQTPFDTPLPAEPSRRIDHGDLASLRDLLARRFGQEPAYQADQTVEDGFFLVVTARTEGGVHESIYEAVTTPVVEEILRLAGG